MSNGEARIRKRFIVSGLVQGVGFRWTTTRIARALGVSGTVRNREDDAVEVEACASAAVLDRFAIALREQTPGRVDSIREEAMETDANEARPEGFRIV